jgi:hypothetical protein
VILHAESFWHRRAGTGMASHGNAASPVVN